LLLAPSYCQQAGTFLGTRDAKWQLDTLSFFATLHYFQTNQRHSYNVHCNICTSNTQIKYWLKSQHAVFVRFSCLVWLLRFQRDRRT